MSENSINKPLSELATSVLNEGLYLRHNNNKRLVPFMVLKTKKERVLRPLDPDIDPLDQAQTIVHSLRKKHTHIIIVHEASLYDENENRVDSIIVDAFDLSLKKGLQIAQRFNKKNAGGFKKIGLVSTLGTPTIIFELQKLGRKNKVDNEPHFNSEIKKDTKNLNFIQSELSHHSPDKLSEAIKDFVLDKLSDTKSNTYNGLFEINIIKNASIKNTGLLQFLCTNAINEVLGSKISNNWIKVNNRNLIITCSYDNSELYQAIASKNELKSFKLSNYLNYNRSQLDHEFKSVLFDLKKTANIKSIVKFSKLKFEYNRRDIEKSLALETINLKTDNVYVAKKLIIGSTVILLVFLNWLFFKSVN